MNKTSFKKTLVMAALVFTMFPLYSSADQSIGSYFQAVVLSQERSPKLNLRVGRFSIREAAVNVSSVITGKPINRVKIFSMTRSAEVFFLGITDRKGDLYFENGYKHVMQLHRRGGYRKAEKFHSTGDIDLVIAMIGNESSVALFKKAKHLKPTY